MHKKVFIIQESFQITGRGLIVVGKKEDKKLELKMGIPLVIVTTEGKEIHAKVIGLEMFYPPKLKTEAILIGDFSKSDIPIGSTVFVDE